MNFECIIYDKEPEEGIATIKLNRPRVLNAMNKQLWVDFQQALEDVKHDKQIKDVIVTGEGRAFSSGADLKESKTRSVEEYRDYLTELQEASRKIIRFEKPTIAAINGYAIGSGIELALACDLRIAAEEAKMGSTEASVTASVTGGAMRLFQSVIGPEKAKKLLFTAELIDGKEAERIGLVSKTVPSDQLMETAREIAAKIAKNSAFSIKLIKNGLNLAQGEMSLEALMDYEIEAALACVTTEERKEKLEAFEARRQVKSSPEKSG